MYSGPSTFQCGHAAAASEPKELYKALLAMGAASPEEEAPEDIPFVACNECPLGRSIGYLSPVSEYIKGGLAKKLEIRPYDAAELVWLYWIIHNLEEKSDHTYDPARDRYYAALESLASCFNRLLSNHQLYAFESALEDVFGAKSAVAFHVAMTAVHVKLYGRNAVQPAWKPWLGISDVVDILSSELQHLYPQSGGMQVEIEETTFYACVPVLLSIVKSSCALLTLPFDGDRDYAGKAGDKTHKRTVAEVVRLLDKVEQDVRETKSELYRLAYAMSAPIRNPIDWYDLTEEKVNRLRDYLLPAKDLIATLDMLDRHHVSRVRKLVEINRP